MIYINAQIIFFELKKLIAMTIVFHKLYQCDIMSEVTLNIILDCYRYTNHHIDTQMIFFAFQKLITISIVFRNHANEP